MIIFPAIDIKDKMCVRLFKGDYSTAHKVAEDPYKTAEKFLNAGSEWIHMVDLDGAKSGSPCNSEIFIRVTKESGLKAQVGGGIRNLETIRYYIDNGISRVILGSIAVRDNDFVKQAIKEFGEKIAVSIDASNEMVATDGWINNSGVHYLELAKKMEDAGVSTIIYTDISRDGTLEGPNLEQQAAINNAVSCNIIASGGIKSLDDIKNLKSIGIYGAICGKSIYQGTLDLGEAIKLSKE